VFVKKSLSGTEHRVFFAPKETILLPETLRVPTKILPSYQSTSSEALLDHLVDMALSIAITQSSLCGHQHQAPTPPSKNPGTDCGISQIPIGHTVFFFSFPFFCAQRN
jgi:hypothetical protein